MIERLNGLWDGRIHTPSQLAIELGTSRSNCGLIRDRAYARIARDLDSGSPRFSQEMRAAYILLLASNNGMARKGEWADQSSFLLRNNREYCLAFSFLCRASRIEPASLGVISEEGVCFDSLLTKSRYDKTIAVVVNALETHGRPLPLADRHDDGVLDLLGLHQTQDLGAEIDEGFLRRCLQLSSQCGLDESNMASRRSWPFFVTKSLKDLAHRALLELGKPASPAEVFRTIGRLFPRRKLRLESLIAALAAHPEHFMRVGFRLHGLRAWGLASVPKQADFLATELRRRGGKATSQELYAEGQRIHGFKLASLWQTLNIHPERFRRAPGRVWELVSVAVPSRQGHAHETEIDRPEAGRAQLPPVLGKATTSGPSARGSR